MRRILKSGWLATGSLAAPVLVLVSVFWPEIRHYHVPTVPIDDEAIQGMRSSPGDSLFRELSAYTLFPRIKRPAEKTLETAEGILRGKLPNPDDSSILLDIPMRQAQVEAASPEFQLKLSGLLVPELLLDAYEITGKGAYFDAARSEVIRWAKQERSAWFPQGYLWNDHAIAGRIFVLARFWMRYRSHPSFRTDEARIVLQAADRGARMLAKPGSFTFASNHGVMQNLALLHACAAFPGLGNVPRFRETALERLGEQLEFYVSGTGVVTEHSTAYHELGLQLMAMALRYAGLLGSDVPAGWRSKYEGMLRFEGLLVRPDGTLPMYGGSERKARESLPVVSAWSEEGAAALAPRTGGRPALPAYFDPVAGYALWWRGLERWPEGKGLSQVMIAWPNFVSRVHKHADEMSVFLWADGKDWWVGSGYWPYGAPDRARAESWEGSNAPHAVGESPRSERRTAVKHHSCLEGTCAMDIERTTRDGYRARRQVVQAPGAWLVVDAVRDSLGRGSRVAWTTLPRFETQRGDSANSFALVDVTDSSRLAVAYDVSPGGGIRELKGSRDPFAGWVSLEMRIRPTHAFLIDLPADGWAAAAWMPGIEGRAPLLRVAMRSWAGPESWRAEILSGTAKVEVERDARGFRISAPEHPDLRLPPAPPAESELEAGRMRESFLRGALRYPRYAESHFPYRLKAGWFVLGLICLQESVLLLAGRFLPRVRPALRGAAIPAWVALGFWLTMVYFSA